MRKVIILTFQQNGFDLLHPVGHKDKGNKHNNIDVIRMEIQFMKKGMFTKWAFEAKGYCIFTFVLL